MNKHFLRKVSAILLAAACLFSIQIAAADEIKLIAVGSFSGYDALYKDIDTLGKVSGNPDLAMGLEAMLKFATRSQGLAGLDKTKPWGVAVYTVKPEPSGYAFLPITDLDKLLAVLEPFVGKAQSAGNDILKISGVDDPQKEPVGPIFIKKKGSWLIVSKKIENLALASVDPGKLLGNLPKKYDLAINIEVANIPAALRNDFIGQIQKNVEKDLKRHEKENANEHLLRKQVAAEIVGMMERAANDVRRVTLGLTLDNETEKIYLDLNLLPKHDSGMQSLLQRWTASKTDFAGFSIPDAALACGWSVELTDNESGILKNVLKIAHAKAVEDIERQHKSPQHREAAKRFVKELFDIVGSIAEKKRLDGAVSLLLEPGAATLMGAKHVPDAARLEKMAQHFAEMVVAEHPQVKDIATVKANIEEFEGVRFHAISVPLPNQTENRDKVVALVGETLEAVVGVSNESVYVAVGRNPMAKLKKAIDASAKHRNADIAPLRVSIGLRCVAGIIAEMADTEAKREKAASLAKLLETANKQDHLIFTAKTIADGLRLRFEVEGGIVKSLGVMSTMLPSDLINK